MLGKYLQFSRLDLTYIFCLLLPSFLKLHDTRFFVDHVYLDISSSLKVEYQIHLQVKIRNGYYLNITLPLYQVNISSSYLELATERQTFPRICNGCLEYWSG